MQNAASQITEPSVAETSVLKEADVECSLSDKEYQESVATLRLDLLRLQRALHKQNFPVILLISGVDGGGKGDVINKLNEWMDPRFVYTHGFASASDEEKERPEMWRFWRVLPGQGEMAILVGSWYSEPFAQRARKDLSAKKFDRSLQSINRFEKTLVDDGALLIKCSLHLSKQQQKKKTKKLLEDPKTRWRVTKAHQRGIKMYDKFRKIAEHGLAFTNTQKAPWFVINGADQKYASVAVARHILERYEAHLGEKPPPRDHRGNTAKKPERKTNVLSRVSLDRPLAKKTYTRNLGEFQGKLHSLSLEAQSKDISVILLFEGWDAGGKGGAILRVAHAIDPRRYQIIRIAAPTDEERAHHYLWRFWRHLPRAGQMTIYDRSWYGRVLVERVEKFAREDEWLRAYSEINAFEQQITDHKIVFAKFFLHISKDEQLRRFKERELIPHKRHKVTEEDRRNRRRWPAYEVAIQDMVEKTSTDYAPWHIIPGNNKRHARIQVLKTVCEKMEQALD